VFYFDFLDKQIERIKQHHYFLKRAILLIKNKSSGNQVRNTITAEVLNKKNLNTVTSNYKK